MRRPDCLLIEGCDFESFPPGGQLSTAKQMLRAFGDRLALVGICSRDDVPVGRWVERELSGKRVLFFGIGRRSRSARRPLVPARITQGLDLARHRDGILSLGVRNVFIEAVEDLFVVTRWKLDSVCLCLPGLENPLSISRYPWARRFAGALDRALFAALAKVQVILASADDRAIEEFVARSRGTLAPGRVVQLCTHYDSSVFRPLPLAECRRALGIPEGSVVVVTTGRINRAKGWDLLLDAYQEFRRECRDALLVFVGDGEDRPELEQRIELAGLIGRGRVTGFVPPATVASWLNAADLYVVGSRAEGWSIAMLEALACGKPLVSTDVSGARTLVRDRENGFVVSTRSAIEFAARMRAALALPDAAAVSREIARRHDIVNLPREIGEVWKVLA
jgi:glycosyltransferase involved in cell wall biosynthesis